MKLYYFYFAVILVLFIFSGSLSEINNKKFYESCDYCHSNKTLMEDYKQFIFLMEEVWNESKMFREGLGGPLCSDCHLGNGTSFEKEISHENMLSLIVVGKNKLMPINRSYYSEIKNYSSKIHIYLLNGTEYIKTILYHDRNRNTYAFDINIANKTCGKCHSKIVEEFSKSIMGSVKFQSLYVNFSYPAPHDCGYWLKDIDLINRQLAVEYTEEQAELNRRVCNQCHVSCLDCHYKPQSGKHAFSRDVEPQTCYYGNGRGICHSGAEEFRRGTSYFRGYFTNKSDVHAEIGLSCLDCHLFMNHNIERKAFCRDCHKGIEKKVKRGVHKNLSCEACHISYELGGYQIVVWGPGIYWNMTTPLTKHKYYGKMNTTLLIKNEKGIWIPVKPVPHFVLNMKEKIQKTGLKFRNVEGRNFSNDAYIIFGTFKIKKNSYAVAWLHMDKASHGLSKGKNCTACHLSGVQTIMSNWWFKKEYSDDVFLKGRTIIVANSSGIYVRIYGAEDYKEINRSELYDYAPWIELTNFSSRGDYSLPKISDECGKNCLNCHLSYHETILPKYRVFNPYLYIILIILIMLFVFTIIIRK